MASADLPLSSTEQLTSTLPPRRKWTMLVVLSLALAIIILDTTILNVALSAIIRDLQTDIQKIQWVITAYSLTLAALTITGGRLGDLFGRKRMFVVGAFLFAVGSFIASISTNVGTLVAGEAIIEGIGAALMMPATASLLVANFQGRERAIAFGVWGGIAGASAALGPILGGYLTTHYNWRWGFRINLVVVLLLMIGSVLIPESRDTKEKKELDFVGVFLSALGMLALVFGIIESSTYGWWKAKTAFLIGGTTISLPWHLSVVPAFVALGVIVLGVFGWWEYRRERLGHTPLVSMKLFKNTTFTAGVSTTAVMSLGQTGLIFALPVFLQSVRGLDAYHTGLALLPMSLALLFVAPLSAALGKKVPANRLINLGLLVNVCAYLVLRRTLNIETTSTDLIPGLALFGVGMGLVMSQINNLTLSAVPLYQAGEASGVNNTLRQVGSTLGAAIIGTVLLSTLSAELVQGVQTSSVLPEPLKASIATAVQSQTSNVEFGGGAQVGSALPPGIQTEIVRIGHVATVEANKQSLTYGAIFALLGFLVSLRLPSTKKKEGEGAKQESLAPAFVSPTLIPRMEQKVDTILLSELLQTELARTGAEKPSLAPEIRLILDAASLGQGLSRTMHARLMQARILWDAGFGKALSKETFAAYVAEIPEVPPELLTPDPAFPLLILVEARLSPQDTCAILGIGIRGNDKTAEMKELQQTSAPYWIRCHQGSCYLGKAVQEAEGQFKPSEQPLTLVEGLALVAQYPDAITACYLDLPGTRHEGFENSAACLGVWNEVREIRFRWRDHADPRCQTVSKKSPLA